MSSKLLLATAAFLLTGLVAGAAVKVGDKFPAFDKMGINNAPATSGKVVLVDFWASWCGPCKQSFPALDRLYAKYRARGFVVVAVSVDENVDDMKAFLDDHSVSFPVVHDSEHRLVETAEVDAMPTSFLIGRDGEVVAVHNGFRGDETEDALAAEIERLVK